MTKVFVNSHFAVWKGVGREKDTCTFPSLFFCGVHTCFVFVGQNAEKVSAPNIHAAVNGYAGPASSPVHAFLKVLCSTACEYFLNHTSSLSSPMLQMVDYYMLLIIGNTALGVGPIVVQSKKFALFNYALIPCSFSENLIIHYFGD